MQLRKKLFGSPDRTIVLSVIGVVIIGTILLSCKWAQNTPISLLDTLFTSISAICVTGLMTIPLESFSSYGHVVILCLIQIGALGLITLTIFFLSLFINIDLSTQAMAGEVFEIQRTGKTAGRTRKIVYFIIFFTGIIELIGSLLIWFTIRHQYPFPRSIFISLFQGISAFCSSGFTLISFQPGAVPLTIHVSLLCITAVLVLIGGLGFIVWNEIVLYLQSLSKRKHFHFSLQSKIVFSISALLISCMSVLLFALEYWTDFLINPSWYPFIAAPFNAICLQSAGFTSFDMSTIHLATLFAILVFCFIGSSPGSTGSGIKTTTFVVFLAAIRATLFRRNAVEVKGRTIPNDQVFKAMAILFLSLAWIAITLFCLFITEKNICPMDLILEAFSAFTNLGLSRNVTPHLSYVGKYIIMFSMIIGRIGYVRVPRKQKGAA